MQGIGRNYSKQTFGAYKKVRGVDAKSVLDVSKIDSTITKSTPKTPNRPKKRYNQMERLYLKAIENFPFSKKGGTELP